MNEAHAEAAQSWTMAFTHEDGWLVPYFAATNTRRARI